MSFFDKLFPNRSQPTPIESEEEELCFLKKMLNLSLSKTHIQQCFAKQEYELKVEVIEESIYQGKFGFMFVRFNEDHEAYEFIYTDISTNSHQLVKGDHHQYGQLTFKLEEET